MFSKEKNIIGEWDEFFRSTYQLDDQLVLEVIEVLMNFILEMRNSQDKVYPTVYTGSQCVAVDGLELCRPGWP